MSTEKQLNQRIINTRESKYTSIQPEYQSSAFFNRPLPISFLLSKQECPLKQQHSLDWKMDLQNVHLQNSSNPFLPYKHLTLLGVYIFRSLFGRKHSSCLDFCFQLSPIFPFRTSQQLSLAEIDMKLGTHVPNGCNWTIKEAGLDHPRKKRSIFTFQQQRNANPNFKY